jgi:hypothetical protein
VDGRLNVTVERDGAAEIDEADAGMIDHDVRAAFFAVTPIPDLAAFELLQKLFACGNLHVIQLPQGGTTQQAPRNIFCNSRLFADFGKYYGMVSRSRRLLPGKLQILDDTKVVGFSIACGAADPPRAVLDPGQRFHRRSRRDY